MTEKGLIIYSLLMNKLVDEAKMPIGLSEWTKTAREILDKGRFTDVQIPDGFIEACLEVARHLTHSDDKLDLMVLRNKLRYSNILRYNSVAEMLTDQEPDCDEPRRVLRHISFISVALEAGLDSNHWFGPCHPRPAP